MIAERDPQERKIVDTVARVGWAVMTISPNNDDIEPRWFAYTVGLAVTFGWPELICFGLDLSVMTELLNNAVLEIRQRNESPAVGMELTEVAEGLPMRLAAFPKEYFRGHLGWAVWYADLRGLEPRQFGCYQLPWPDKMGRFPDGPECVPEVRELQSAVNRLK
jgi:Domain of unknown function (DUF4262)